MTGPMIGDEFFNGGSIAERQKPFTTGVTDAMTLPMTGPMIGDEFFNYGPIAERQ